MSSSSDMGKKQPGIPGTPAAPATPATRATGPGQSSLPAITHALELVGCPECGAPAEVEWRHTIASTGGPVEHLKIRCVNRHWFLLTQESLDIALRGL